MNWSHFDIVLFVSYRNMTFTFSQISPGGQYLGILCFIHYMTLIINSIFE